ncbi:MAG: response regulator [Chloroflexi bacterium]|nr:response regulator [Chloroflexota bacterium]
MATIQLLARRVPCAGAPASGLTPVQGAGPRPISPSSSPGPVQWLKGPAERRARRDEASLSAESSPAAEHARGGASRPILVVDDDYAIRTTVADILALEGYAVEVATNGVEALTVVDRVRPSLVLLDMRMPVLDGWGFTRALRERGVNVPILVMTAAVNARRWAEEVGADGYLAKPFELAALLSAVKRLSRRRDD